MTADDKRLEQAAKFAEQMEIDGKAYYLALAGKTPNRRGRDLFRILAAEEDQHRTDFASIYQVLCQGRPVPPEALSPHLPSRVRTVFSQGVEALESDIQAPDTELQAIDTAIAAEQKSIDFYAGEMKAAHEARPKRFYEHVIHEEQGHKDTLLDYRHYIRDPEGWLVSKSLPVPGSVYVPGAPGYASESEW